MIGESVIDVDFAQRAKHEQFVAGDVFLSRKLKDEGRVLSVLSDGLGSGVKASVLANLTATMALKYAAAFVDVRRSAQIIMDTLPVCEIRKISYSTFTIIDVGPDGDARVIEHGNPPFILLRGDQPVELEKEAFTLEQWKDRVITHASFQVRLGDRLVAFSDGVTQSGMGSGGMPLGWTSDRATDAAAQRVRAEPGISSLHLAQAMVDAAVCNDGQRVKDDITCGVVSFRTPRRLLVVTGPPFKRERDRELSDRVEHFEGRRIICGGTTAGIVARLLNRDVKMDLTNLDPEIPPTSVMEGVDLITEGTLTLARTADALESGGTQSPARPNAVDQLARMMLDSDIIEFLVGTRINEAHQDPNVPVELDLRRNIVRRIVSTLETRYLKQVSVRLL